jgi:hypothetical protein
MGAVLAPALPFIAASFPAWWPFVAVALLVFAASYILRKPLVAILSLIPLIGGQIAGAVDRGISGMIYGLNAWANSLAWPVIQLIMAPVAVAVAFTTTTVATIEYTMDQLVVVARTAAGQIGQLATSVNLALHQSAQAIAQLAGQAAQLVNLGNSLNWLRATFIPASIAGALAAAQHFARQLVTAETTARAQAIAATDARVAAGLGAEGQARLAGDQAGAAALASATSMLGAAILANRAAMQAYTDAQTSTLANELTQVKTDVIPKAEARATARANAVAAELAAVRLACVTPLCNIWGNQFGLLQALMTGAELAAVLGLVAYAVRDPEGAAGSIAGAAGGFHAMGSGLLSPVLGRQV